MGVAAMLLIRIWCCCSVAPSALYWLNGWDALTGLMPVLLIGEMI